MKLKYLVIVYNLHLASFINITKVYTEDIIFFGHDSVVSLIISYLKLAVLFFLSPNGCSYSKPSHLQPWILLIKIIVPNK